MNAERQPIFNAPWIALALAGVIIGGYGVQRLFDQDQVIMTWGFSAVALAAGRWETALSSLFIHANTAHAVMNGAFALAFGTPVNRYMGENLRGFLVFTLFYLLCGVIACLGYGAIHADSAAPLIGASGAVSGLMGGAVRLMAGRGLPGPYRSSPVVGMTVSWVAINLLFAFIGFVPGLGEGAMAWEAHLIGYAAGLFLIGPFGAMAGQPRSAPVEH